MGLRESAGVPLPPHPVDSPAQTARTAGSGSPHDQEVYSAVKKKVKAAIVTAAVLLLLSHLPYPGGQYGLSTPYHPLRLFSFGSDAVVQLDLTDGYGGCRTIVDREEIAARCETLDSFRYVFFVPDFLPRRGHSGETLTLRYEDGSFRHIYVKPFGFYRSGVGWYFGFGGGRGELRETIAQLR